MYLLNLCSWAASLLKHVLVSSFCFPTFSVCASSILWRSCRFVLVQPQPACSCTGTCSAAPSCQPLASGPALQSALLRTWPLTDLGCQGGDEMPICDALSWAKDCRFFSLLCRSPARLGWWSAGCLYTSRCFETWSIETDKTPWVSVTNCHMRNEVVPW